MRRIQILAITVVCAGLFAGCGNEAPHPGNLTVTSDPVGAAILLDGDPTGEVTPYTFSSIEAKSYTVAVTLDGYTVIPEEQTVVLPFGGNASTSFTLAEDVGSLTVTSTPPRAAIELDGADSGFLTPHTFENLVPQDYTVAVSLANYATDQTSLTIAVVGNDEVTAAFTLSALPGRVVLFEGFSNTYCSGCPAFNANVGLVMDQDGYGADRLVFVKWPAFLVPLDPFWTQTQTETNDRVAWYDNDGNMSLPSCFANGVLLGTEGVPVNAEGMTDYIDSQPELADFSIIVSTDEDLTDVDELVTEATVTLQGFLDADLSGCVLNVALVYEEVTTERDYPYGNGSEFHWVLRDHYQTAEEIGPLSAGQDMDFEIILTDPDPAGIDPGFDTLTPHGKQIIAWVQNSSSKAVLQAGSTADTAKVAQ